MSKKHLCPCVGLYEHWADRTIYKCHYYVAGNGKCRLFMAEGKANDCLKYYPDSCINGPICNDMHK